LALHYGSLGLLLLGAHQVISTNPATRVAAVAKSVLEAIREGDWYFEPAEVDSRDFEATKAIPGTRAKLDVLAERASAGLPLWHDRDRPDYEEVDD
jgi:hypothetical protein